MKCDLCNQLGVMRTADRYLDKTTGLWMHKQYLSNGYDYDSCVSLCNNQNKNALEAYRKLALAEIKDYIQDQRDSLAVAIQSRAKVQKTTKARLIERILRDCIR